MPNDNEKCLVLDDGYKLQFLNKDPSYYINTTTIIYGATRTGKSVLIDEILYILKDLIPVIFVIAPTNSANNTYTNKVPSHCIKKDMTVEWLEKLITRQINVTEAYSICNKLDVLQSIFNKVASQDEIDKVNNVIERASRCMLSVDSNDKFNFAQKKTQKTAIKTYCDKTVRIMYKTCIRYNKLKLGEYKDLNQIQKSVIKLLDMVPSVIFILDDCASQFKNWVQQRPDLFKSLFYDGRWKNITTIIAFQDDKEIKSELRKNANITFFTTEQAAVANFERSANNFSKYEKEMARRVIKTIFHQPENEPTHYQKLCYIRGEKDPFRYIIADLHDEFKFGCGAIWDFDKKMGNDDNINRSNPFLKFD